MNGYLSFIATSAISATGVFDGFPPGPTPFDELAAYGKLVQGGFRSIRGSASSFSYLVNGRGIDSELVDGGFLEFAIETVGTKLRGTDLFYKAVAHYGSYLKGIRGNWHNTAIDPSNKNLGFINILTQLGYSVEDAAKETFTGRRAAALGFTNYRLLTAPLRDGSGRYTEVYGEFY